MSLTLSNRTSRASYLLSRLAALTKRRRSTRLAVEAFPDEVVLRMAGRWGIYTDSGLYAQMRRRWRHVDERAILAKIASLVERGLLDCQYKRNGPALTRCWLTWRGLQALEELEERSV